jgi:isopenicillin-N epimerase
LEEQPLCTAAGPLDTLATVRELFLLDPDLVFLNHGSFGACPREVFADFQRWQLEMERNPVEFLGRRSAALLAASRARLAAYVGASAEHLVYVPNATTGVNIVARSFALRPGDEVLATDHEYGACDATWRFVCAQRGATYRRVPIPLPFESEAFADRVLAAVTPRTRVIFASHVTSTTALVFPLAELCRHARGLGIPTLIDGAHAPGQIPLDLDALGADFYAGNCHKWLCSPKGAGFLHARPEHHAMLDAPVVSWGYAASVEGHAGFDAYTGASLLERRLQWQGTRDIAAWLAVPAAMEFQQRHDWPAVQRRCHALAADALHRLASRFGLAPISGDDDFAQMVAIPVPHSDAEVLRERLFCESRIEIPVTRHGSRTFVRLSVQGYNTEADLQRLLAAPALAGG